MKKDLQSKSAEEQVEILRKAGFKLMSEIQAVNTTFLWYPYIPAGKVTLLQGDPAGGKTTLILNLLASMSRGERKFGGHKLDWLRNESLYMTAEDGYNDTVVPRLMNADANLKRIYTLTKNGEFWNLLDALMDVCEIMHPSLIALDPIQAFFGSGDMNRANDVREVMSTFGEIAQYYNVAIVLVGHLNKKSGDNDLYRGLGSIDFVASARSVLQVAKNANGQRILKHVKSSLSERGEDLEIVIENGKMELIPYEPPAVEGKRTTQQSKIPEATKALIANMHDEWWTRQQIIDFLRTEWQITSDAVSRQIVGGMAWKANGRSRLYHAPTT